MLQSAPAAFGVPMSIPPLPFHDGAPAFQPIPLDAQTTALQIALEKQSQAELVQMVLHSEYGRVANAAERNRSHYRHEEELHRKMEEMALKDAALRSIPQLEAALLLKQNEVQRLDKLVAGVMHANNAQGQFDPCFVDRNSQRYRDMGALETIATHKQSVNSVYAKIETANTRKQTLLLKLQKTIDRLQEESYRVAVLDAILQYSKENKKARSVSIDTPRTALLCRVCCCAIR